MQKLKIVLITLLVVTTLALGALLIDRGNKVGNYNPFNGINTLDSISYYATSTKSYCATCPVKLIDLTSSRQWMRLSTNSNSAVYIYFANSGLALNLTEAQKDSFTAATGTITTVTGLINLASTTDKYLEFKLDNQWNGQVWATTTENTAATVVNVVYTQ